MNQPYEYPGEELDVFEEAKNWKRYLASHLAPYVKGKVLEVGAGLGETTAFVHTPAVTHWTALEPDPKLFDRLMRKAGRGELPGPLLLMPGFIEAVPEEPAFDTILYIDVLEHIKDDAEEMRKATARLLPGGHVIVLSPAYPFLYSPFDKAVGHWRRYTARTLRNAARHQSLREIRMFHLESAGLSLLFANKFLLRSRYPSRRGIQFWERVIIPISKRLDKLLFYRVGKSIIGIWQKT